MLSRKSRIYMSKIVEKFNKLSLPAVILIASIILGGFYYASQVNKQKSIERQQYIKIEQEKQEQLDKELKEQQIKEEVEQALNTCISDANENYSNQWYTECKSQGKITNKCVSLKKMSFDEYIKQKNIPKDKSFDAIFDFAKEKEECSCSLPLDLADRVNKSLQNGKDECFKKYPQK